MTGLHWNQRCRATSKRSGERCRRWAMHGLTVCYMHGGSTKRARAKGAEVMRRRFAQGAAAQLGASVDIDPAEALLEAVKLAQGETLFWRAYVAELSTEEGGGFVDLDDPDGWSDDGKAGRATRREWRSGIVGANHLGDQALHVAVGAYREAREHLARVSRLAIQSGIEERLVRVRAEEAQLLYDVLRATLSHFGVDAAPGSAAALFAKQQIRAIQAADVVDADVVDEEEGVAK